MHLVRVCMYLTSVYDCINFVIVLSYHLIQVVSDDATVNAKNAAHKKMVSR